MRSVVYNETGGPEVLRVVHRDVPEPGPGEVRVRVVCSGVNPTDWKSRSGLRTPAKDQVPNQDGSGVVDAVGPGVQGPAVGDRVWLYLSAFQRPSGTAQEFTVVPAERVVPLPDNGSFELGASLGVPAMTAHRALTIADGGPSRLEPGALAGRTVLVAGGAGAVGHAAIQLARWAGATVVTTISGPEKAALAKAAGAHHVVNYREADAQAELRKLAPNGVDQVVEVSPARNAELNLAVVANHATVAVYANDGGDDLTLDVRAHFAVNVQYKFLLLYTVGQEALDAAAADINRAILDGALPVGEEAGLPIRKFPLERTGEAHTAVQNGVIGKVVVEVGAS